MTDVTVRSVAPRLAFSCPVAPAGRRPGLGSSRRNGSSGRSYTWAVTQHESVQGPGAGSVTGSAAQSAAAAQVQLHVERSARAVEGRNKGDARSGIGTIPF